MIHNLSAWKKINEAHPDLLTNGKSIVLQKRKFTTSRDGFLVGVFLAIFGIAILLERYFASNFPFSFISFNLQQIIPEICVIAGIWLAIKARNGKNLRQEQGGIHPTDILIILDGQKKEVTQQINTSEKFLTSFKEMRIENETRRDGKRNYYCQIQIRYTGGKEILAVTSTKTSAQKLTQDIENIIFHGAA